MDVTSTPTTQNPTALFYNATRPKHDSYTQNADALANSAALQWNMIMPSQTMERAIDVASRFPAMQVGTGNGGMAAGGADVDLFSRLRMGDDGTSRQKGHQQLFARPWATTPNMAGGPSAMNKDTESRLMQSETVRQLKAVSTVTDKTFPNHWTPMIPELKSEMADESRFVEQFVRGGEASRLFFKNGGSTQ